MVVGGCKCCKDCTKRKANCHAWCDEFKAWEKAHREEREQIQAYKLQEVCGYYGQLDRRTKYLQRKKREMWRR